MAGRGQMPPPHARFPFMGPGMHPLGTHHLDELPRPELLEQRLAVQHAEMQRLAVENQRLAATHVTLRQDLIAARQEIQRMHAHIGAIQNDKEQQVRGMMDKIAKMEADLQATESIQAELQQAQADAQSLMSMKQDLTTKAQELNLELQRSHAEVQQIPAMHAELDGLRHEFQRARAAYDYEKATSSEQLQQLQSMEKNFISMEREVERLRTELAGSDKRGSAAAYGAGFKDPEARGPSMYGDGYGIPPMAAAPGGGAAYGTAPGGGAAYGTAPGGGAAYGTAPVGGAAYGTAPGGGAAYGTAPGGAAAYGTGPALGRGGYDMLRGVGSQMPVPPVNGTLYGSGHTPPGRGGYDVARSGSSHVRR